MRYDAGLAIEDRQRRVQLVLAWVTVQRKLFHRANQAFHPWKVNR